MTEEDYGLLLLPDTFLAEPQETDLSGQERDFYILKGIATLHIIPPRAPDVLCHPAPESACCVDLRVLTRSWGITTFSNNQEQNFQG